MAGNPNAGQTVGDRPAGTVRGRPRATGDARRTTDPTWRAGCARHAQAPRRPGLPRVRHRRVQAGQVAPWSTPCSTRRSARSTTTSPRRCPPPSATATRRARGRAVRPGRRPVRRRPAEPIREEIPSTRWPAYVTEAADPPASAGSARSRCRCPASCSPTGWSSSTRPASAGWARPTARPPSARCPWPTPCVFVSDASQEFTGPELEFLQTARRMCPNVVCVLTKTDFYPAWRKIRDLDVEHLAPARHRAEILCVSSSLRIARPASQRPRAQPRVRLPRRWSATCRTRSPANAEKLERAVGRATTCRGRRPARDASSAAEREALDRPRATAQRMVDNLTEPRPAAERLRSGGPSGSRR